KGAAYKLVRAELDLCASASASAPLSLTEQLSEFKVVRVRRGWLDSALKHIGGAVGGAAVGLVTSAANVGLGKISSSVNQDGFMSNNHDSLNTITTDRE
ncbi:hypothetical protein BGX24_006365, partial [Mortierella sp. AD032]